jgi:hypothetical protein
MKTRASRDAENTARRLEKMNGERLHGSSSRIIKSDVNTYLSPALQNAL